MLSLNCSKQRTGGVILASGGDDSVVFLHSLSTGKVISSLRGHNGPVTAIQFSPSGTVLASAGVDTTILLWGVDSGSQISFLQGHTDVVNALVFIDDNHLLSGGEDAVLCLWNTKRASSFVRFCM